MLTRAELELRLLDFVRRALVSPEVADRVVRATLLFEERLVDSLKILELIAFLEAATGRKIPDTQVVLANFRSIDAMARAFATDGDGAEVRSNRGPTVPRTHSPPTDRIFERSRRHRSFADPSALLTSGLATLNPDGGIDLHDSALSLVRHFDGWVTEWARELGACEVVFPLTIRVAALERAGFTEAFPDKVVPIEGDANRALPPAVCYHYYPRLENRTIPERGVMVTARGTCFREEADATRPLERLRSFTMREIVAVGSAEFVEELRHGLIQRVSRWLGELDLDAFIETATDPFFTSESRGRLLMQQLQPLKYELRLPVSVDGQSVAAGSFNNHQDHFGKAFSIQQSNGEPAHSGCVAFGWERWLLAFIAQHGADEEKWPVQIRRQYAAAV